MANWWLIDVLLTAHADLDRARNWIWRKSGAWGVKSVIHASIIGQGDKISIDSSLEKIYIEKLQQKHKLHRPCQVGRQLARPPVHQWIPFFTSTRTLHLYQLLGNEPSHGANVWATRRQSSVPDCHKHSHGKIIAWNSQQKTFDTVVVSFRGIWHSFRKAMQIRRIYVHIERVCAGGKNCSDHANAANVLAASRCAVQV